MTKLVSLIFIGLSLSSCKHHILVDKTELKEIFTLLTISENTPHQYYLIDSIQYFERKSITESDTTYFKSNCNVVNAGVWTNEIFDSAKIISRNYLDSISRPDPLMRTPTHYIFSLPYFSKDKTSFIVYYNYYCGNLCAEYSLRLYKKINGKWTFIKTYFKMVS